MNWYLISLFLIVTMTTIKYLLSPSLVTFSTLADFGSVLNELLTKLTNSSFLVSSKSLVTSFIIVFTTGSASLTTFFSSTTLTWLISVFSIGFWTMTGCSIIFTVCWDYLITFTGYWIWIFYSTISVWTFLKLILFETGSKVNSTCDLLGPNT